MQNGQPASIPHHPKTTGIVNDEGTSVATNRCFNHQGKTSQFAERGSVEEAEETTDQSTVRVAFAAEGMSQQASAAADEGDEEGMGHGVVVSDPSELPEIKKKKKKKSRRSAAKRGIGKPTGMEEFYADAPLTPAEYEEELKLYDLELSVLDRILTAIQRFERTRKLTPERRDVFYKWLHYGGIKVSPNIGTGGQSQEDMDQEQIATALSQVQIPDDLRRSLQNSPGQEPQYAIDFMGCMRSFFSRAAPSIYVFDTPEAVELITTTCERFMDYLLQHDVCQEYENDILETRNFCREASSDIWACAEAQRWLPGDFNVACSTLFGGGYASNFSQTADWDNATNDHSALFVGQSREVATEICRFGVAGAASQEVYENFVLLNESFGNDEGLEVVRIIRGQGFEITDIKDPTADCKDMYKTNSDHYRPVGRVTAKPWKNPSAPPEDLTDTEKASRRKTRPSTDQFVFFVEGIVLQRLCVGQKIMATIRELNCGIWFFDEVTRVYPKFDLWLLNELVEDYKMPEWLPGAYAPGASGWDEFAAGQIKDGSTQKETEKGKASGPVDAATNLGGE